MTTARPATREAEVPDHCHQCDDGIRPGDLIVRCGKGWAHDRCPSDKATL